ncbi:MAG TPA: hypothetical protein VM369_06530 [Candidatus Binatia bacterium]|nr:hypothetical protein [Candidatus Binatia bacterium]
MLFARIAGLAGVAALAGCATTHRALPESARSIGATEVVAVVPQHEIYADFDASRVRAATVQFGLIGALVGSAIDAGVNSSRAQTAENTIAPARNALVDYHFEDRLRARLDELLKPLPWLGARPVEIQRDATQDALDARLARTATDALMLVGASYLLSADFGAIIVRLDPLLLPHSERFGAVVQDAGGPGRADEAAASDAAYFDHFTIEVRSPSVAGSRDEAVAAWAANNGALLRQALDMAALEGACLIAAALKDAEGLRGEELVKLAHAMSGSLGRTHDAIRFAGVLDGAGAPVPAALLATSTPPSDSAPAPASTAASIAAPTEARVMPATLGPGAAAASARTVSSGTLSTLADPPPPSLVLDASTSLHPRPVAASAASATVGAGSTLDVLSSTHNGDGYWLLVRAHSGEQGWVRAR